MNDKPPVSEFLVISLGQWDADAPQEKVQHTIDEFYAWHDRCVVEGKMKPGQRLAVEGKRVSRHAVTDGPFSEAKEIVGGYWFIYAENLAAAAALAAENPCLAYGLQYEIRPIDPSRCNASALTNETPTPR